MAAVDESHFPTEQKCTHDEKTGPGEVVRMCRSECNATQIDNATSGSSSDRPVDSQQDTRASSANTVSPAACVWKPPAGDATRTGPDQDNQTSPEAHIPCNVTHRTPMSGDERGDGEARDVHCDLNFTKLLVQPDNMSDVDMEKADKIKDSPDDKSHERDTLNGLEEDIGIEGTGNSVDSKTGDKVDAITKCKNVNLQCKDCGKRFNRRETLNLHRHFHAHNDPTPLTCKECDLTFQDRSSFIKHRKAHKEKKQEMIGSQRSRFTCAHCGKCFSKVEKLRGHNCNKFPDKPYHCPLCRREFQFKVAIPKHMQTHSLENIFQCQECNKHFSDGTAFHSHQRSHAALKPYECPECGMAFKHYSVMEDHRRRHTDGMPSHNCNICGKTFKYSSLLHQHQYLHTGQKPFCCPECGKTFAFAQNMKAHYRQHRLSTTTPLVPAYRPSKKEPVPSHEPAPGLGKENTGQSVKLRPVYNCPLCPLKFDIPAKLRTHMLIHEAESEKLENAPIKGTYELMNSEKGYNCPQCPRILHTKQSYHGHLLKAHKAELCYLEQGSAEHTLLRRTADGHSKSHRCPQCTKVFRHYSVLEIHMRVHSKDRPYQCKVCDKSFRCNSYMRQHMIIHTGERPHKCPDCGKEFAFLQNMRTHLKLHKEKPFHCGRCRNRYTDEAQLKQHILSHKGAKRYKCSHCDKSFSIPCLLRDHINTHTGARPYRCAECQKSFSWLSSLLVHQKRHLRLASSPPRQSAMVTAQQPRDNESCLNAFQTQAPMLSTQMETKVKQAELCLSESCPPVQWKVDGGEVLPVSLAHMSNKPQVLAQSVSPQHNHSPLKSLPDPSSVPSLETSNMKVNSIAISGSLQIAMPKAVTPSIVGEVENHRQAQAEICSGMSTSTIIASDNSSSCHFPVSSTYVDGAALWSIQPNPVTSTSQVSPIKQDSSTPPNKDDLNQHTGILTTVGQSGERLNGGALQKQPSPSLAVVSSSAQLDQSKGVLSTTPASLEVCSMLWDMETPTGIPKTSSPSDKLAGNQELQLQQKEEPGWTNQKVPMSLPCEPHRFAHGLGPAVWGFQTNQVKNQPGNAPELLHQPMAVMRPHMPQTLALPQLSPRTRLHHLGGRLPFAPEGLLQCKICGHSLPLEKDLEIHYLQHAEGEI